MRSYKSKYVEKSKNNFMQSLRKPIFEKIQHILSRLYGSMSFCDPYAIKIN